MPREKPFILKVCPHNNDYYREFFYLTKLKNSIPVPNIIATIKPSSNNFGAILMEYVEGELLKNEDLSNHLAFEMGVALAHLHNNQTDGYGDLTNKESLIQEPNLYFNKKFQEELNECKEQLPENLIQKCNDYLDRCQTLLMNVDGPCIVHRDFRPGNIIVSNGKLQAIIDWASARSGFAEQDFCSIENFIPKKSEKWILDGYLSIRPIPNYRPIVPLLQLGRALAVIGYSVKSNTWNSSNSSLYKFYRKFLDSFDFF